MNSDLYQFINQASKDDKVIVTEEDWKQIKEAIDFIFPTFNKHLDDLFPYISLQAKRLCWLSKIGISPVGIAHILKRSRQAITNTRSKMNRLIAESSLPEKTFNDFIEKFS